MNHLTTRRKPAACLSKPKLTGLSYSARKALTVQIGEKAGGEIADLIQSMADEIEELRRTKVSITRIVPGGEPR